MRRAFTLIELLVVISIIAILASMLMPAVKMLLVAADKTRCGNQMRQITLIASAYSIDQESMIVHPWTSVDRIAWDVRLISFAGVNTSFERQFWCRTNPQARFDTRTVDGQALRGRRSYSLVGSWGAWGDSADTKDCAAWTYWYDDTIAGSRSIAQVQSQTTTAFLLEAGDFPSLPTNNRFGDWPGTVAGNPSALFGVHTGRDNLLFYDGHVEAVKNSDPQLWGTGTPAFPRGVWTMPGND